MKPIRLLFENSSHCTYINFPTGENLTAVIQGFQSKWNIPQCAGSVDGTHIPLHHPQ